MTQNKHPVPEGVLPLNYRADVVSQIFDNIKKGESFSFIGIKDNGKVNTLRFLSQRPDVQEEYLGDQASKYLYIMVDLNELSEISLLGFYHLFGSCIVESNKDSGISIEYLNQLFIDNPNLIIKALKEDLANMVEKTGKQIVIIFNNFDLIRKLDISLIYHQLIALITAARSQITYIFTGTRPFEPNTSFFRKIVYMTPFKGIDALGVVKRNCDLYQVELNEDQKEKIIILTGGHAGMIKFAVQNLAGIDQSQVESAIGIMKNNSDLCFQCERILEPLTELEKTKLKAGEKDELLINLGLQNMAENQPRRDNPCEANIFSPILRSHLQEKNDCLSPLVLDVENDEIYLWGKPLKRQLSQKEYNLLTMLLIQPNKVVSREEIMDTIWGKDEFPSDWAFDKLISRLREKLGDSRTNQRLLKTYRNQGMGLR